VGRDQMKGKTKPEAVKIGITKYPLAIKLD
jgi:hypothetical protein